MLLLGLYCLLSSVRTWVRQRRWNPNVSLILVAICIATGRVSLAYSATDGISESSGPACLLQNKYPEMLIGSQGAGQRPIQRDALNLKACRRFCQLDAECRLFVWDSGKSQCTVHRDSVGKWRESVGVVSGLRDCGPRRPCAGSCISVNSRLWTSETAAQPLYHVGVISLDECHGFCEAQDGCTGFSFAESSRTCILETTEAVQKQAFGWTSTLINCCNSPRSLDVKENRYVLSKTYAGWDLADPDHFKFFTDNDPTHGFVDYVGRDEAIQLGLFRVDEDGRAVVSVDVSTTVSSERRGRRSVRLEGASSFSKDTIFVFSASHMPEGCAVWPAFWTLGEGAWPGGGEIDIIEGANDITPTSSCLHTRPGCDFAAAPAPVMSGSWKLVPGRNPPEEAKNCDVEAYGNNLGCCIQWPTRSAFGRRFNAEGGGVFVVELVRNVHVRMWLLRHSEAALFNGDADASQISQFLDTTIPAVFFPLSSGCQSPEGGAPVFSAQRMVLNTALCGDWAAGTFLDDGCGVPGSSPGPFAAGQHGRRLDASPVESCVNLVRNYPQAFERAFWSVNYIKVYEPAP